MAGARARARPSGQGHRDESRLARDAPGDDPPPLERLGARHRIGYQPVHERRAVGAVRPFERGGDAILEPIAPVGETRGFSRGEPHEETDPGSRESAHGQAHPGPEEALPTQGIAENERKQRAQGAAEQAAEPVELGTAQPDLPGHVGNRALQYGQVGHDALLDTLAEKHLFLRRRSCSQPPR